MKNNLNFIFKAKTYTLVVCLLLFVMSCQNNINKTVDINTSEKDKLENFYNRNLNRAYKYLDSINLNNSIEKNRTLYIKSRYHFKKTEPVLSYIEKENYKSLNSPNLLRIQEEDATDIKINQPIGYQVIEENLFTDTIDTLSLNRALKVTASRLKLIEKNSDLNFKDYHILWIVKDAIIRVATTGLSNFDSPVLGASLKESSYTLSTLIDILNIYKNRFQDTNLLKSWHIEIENSLKTLNTNFDSLDRYTFIRKHTNKQLKLLNATQKDWNVKFPFEFAIKNNITSLFSNSTFNLDYFSDYKSDTTYLKTKIALGKSLFEDKRFSIKNNMACATCHIKDKAFTDGKVTFNNKLKRNTPTLTYSGLQKSFFMDNRSGSLEGQIVGVVNNHDEFGTDLQHIMSQINKNKIYSKAFDTLYNRGASDMNIRHAIAAYVRSLNYFNSKFDNNINGKENTLTSIEKKGFNLFMGKAACATCHFPPLFNGTVPPNFNESELEIIGVSETKKNNKLDDDLGRYNIFKTEERKGAFKTPTIRNIALTGPYMHNGVYKTLEQVMNFYNQGGGSGLGFNVPHQTLPFDNLNLSEGEQLAIIAFMKTLTDNKINSI